MSALEIDEGLMRFGFEIYARISPTGTLNTRTEVYNYKTATREVARSLLCQKISKDDLISDIVERYV